LIKAWELVDELSIEYDTFYAQPDYVQVVGTTETVILVSMDVRSSEKTLGYMNMSLPSSILERLLQRYDDSKEDHNVTQRQADDQKDIEYQVRNAIMPLRAVLGETSMKIGDLMSLEEGDVIYLQSEARKPVDVFVGNLNLYRAYPVRKESSTAIQIADILRIR
jgi:flagellar motor switch protein FliM